MVARNTSGDVEKAAAASSYWLVVACLSKKLNSERPGIQLHGRDIEGKRVNYELEIKDPASSLRARMAAGGILATPTIGTVSTDAGSHTITSNTTATWGLDRYQPYCGGRGRRGGRRGGGTTATPSTGRGRGRYGRGAGGGGSSGGSTGSGGNGAVYGGIPFI